MLIYEVFIWCFQFFEAPVFIFSCLKGERFFIGQSPYWGCPMKDGIKSSSAVKHFAQDQQNVKNSNFDRHV